jgi:Sec-independent protein secretion pathway component TatC
VGATRLGLVTPRQLRKNRRYAIVACAVIAALLPGDAITLALETVPLYVLYETSILVASLVGRAHSGAPDGASAGAPPGGDPAPPTNDQAEPTVQDIIDHVDESL